MRARRKALASAVVAALAVAGCGSSSDGSGATQTGAPAAAKPKGEVHFVSPRKGAETTPTVNVKVALKDFAIAPGAVGQAPRPGQGHLHFKMDDGKFDKPRYAGKNGLLGKKLGVNGAYSPALAPTITYSHLPPGEHELEVYLANNNHTNVGVEASVKFRVR